MSFNDLTGSARENPANDQGGGSGRTVVPFVRPTAQPRGKLAGTLRVLLVEDDELDIRLFVMVAEQLGLSAANISIARSIAEARALLASETFDRHVMDYWLGVDTTDSLIAEVLGVPQRSVIVVSNFASVELRAIKGPADRLRVVPKCELTVSSLAEALGVPRPDGSRPDPVDLDMPLSAFALANLKDDLGHLRRLAERIAMTLRLADSHLCEGENEEAHIFIVETMNLHRRAEAKLDGMERQIMRKLQPGQS
jgi:CheY-like chemotaxis protein